jgi:hypothetical protein
VQKTTEEIMPFFAAIFDKKEALSKLYGTFFADIIISTTPKA